MDNGFRTLGCSFGMQFGNGSEVEGSLYGNWVGNFICNWDYHVRTM